MQPNTINSNHFIPLSACFYTPFSTKEKNCPHHPSPYTTLTPPLLSLSSTMHAIYPHHYAKSEELKYHICRVKYLYCKKCWKLFSNVLYRDTGRAPRPHTGTRVAVWYWPPWRPDRWWHGYWERRTPSLSIVKTCKCYKRRKN